MNALVISIYGHPIWPRQIWLDRLFDFTFTGFGGTAWPTALGELGVTISLDRGHEKLTAPFIRPRSARRGGKSRATGSPGVFHM